MTTITHPVLSPDHFEELLVESAINPEVVEGRGYRTVWGTPEDRAEMNALGFSKNITDRDETYPALLVPMWRATGEIIAYQLKPQIPRSLSNGDGRMRPVKYETPRGSSAHIDVPPFTQERLKTGEPLWITEGMKKVDSLISQGRAAIGLTGVYNWRRKLGTLGDWEDIPLKGRDVVICFDADAKDNRNVQLAMRRFGAWLDSKGVAGVHYVIVPGSVGEKPVKGVDDWFAAGGDLAGLQAVASKTPPGDGPKDASFTDAVLSETVCEEELDGSFCWAPGLGWMSWNGHVWNEVSEAEPVEAVRVWALGQFQKVLTEQMKDPSRADSGLIAGWRSVLSKGRIKALVDLARGILLKRSEDFDADPDLLCVRNGYVDLRTGSLHAPDPDLLMTKCAGAEYVPGASSEAWDRALSAVPEDAQAWYRDRIGQAATGHMTPDDLLVIAQGDGENGKSTVVSAIQSALGSYAVLLSDRVLMASPDAHPTELMDLRGGRYAVLEETPEARRLDTHRLKKTVGTEKITARRIRQDDVSFDATHSLFVNTNFRPIVTETDHGTWRRLALLSFPYTYRKPGQPLEHENDREGDPTLRSARHDPAFRRAVLSWIVRGARAWYERGRVMLPPPGRVERDTHAWRAETDLILGFASDMLSFVASGQTPARDMLGAFNEWAEGQGHKAWTEKTLSARMSAHELFKKHRVEKRRIRPEGAGKHSHPVMTWLGVTLSDEDPPDLFSPQNGANPSGNDSDILGGVQGVQGSPVNEKSEFHARVNQTPCTPCTPQVSEAYGQNGHGLLNCTKEQNGQEPEEEPMIMHTDPAHPRPTPAAQTESDEDASGEWHEDGTYRVVEAEAALALHEARLRAPLSASEPEPVFLPVLPGPGPLVRPQGGPVGFDLETRGKELFRADSDFVVLAGHGDRVDKDADALCARMRGSETFVGANVYGFDLIALERHCGLRVEETVGRVRDVQLQAMIADPPTSRETKPGPGFKSYSLDALGTRLLGRPKDERGAALAAHFCTTPRCRHGKSKNCNGWEMIPGDHPDYALYCADDVALVEAVHASMPWTPYMDREMRVQAIMARMTLNGFRVDEDLLGRRIEGSSAQKNAAAQILHERWGFPLGAKSPMATKEGKAWLGGVYERFGVTNPPRTTKSGDLATGAEVLKSISEHPKCPPELKEILDLMAVVTSARTIYQTVADHAVDGRVHPDIWPRQASGRWSVGVGMTVMKKAEREVYLPEPGESIIAVDLAQIDARIVAAHAQDPAYLELFGPGRDIHTETAIAMLGDAKYRNECKPISHLANYGGGQKKLIEMGHDPKLVRQFFKAREEKFPGVLRWQDSARETGASGELLSNGFGRPLRVERADAYTQAPAAVGQGGTRDMMAEGLLDLARTAPECLSMLRVIVHDEVVLSVPTEHAEEISRTVVKCFEREWAPEGASIPVHVKAEASRPGINWADAYGK